MTTASSEPRLVTAIDEAVVDQQRALSGWRSRLRRIFLGASPFSWGCLDALIIGLASSAAQVLLTTNSGSYTWIANPWLASSSFCVCTILAGLVFGLYERRTLMSRSAIVLRSTLTLGLGVVLAFACLSVFFYAHASRWMGLSVIIIYLGAAVPFRLFAHQVITSSHVRILCVGAGDAMRKFVSLLQESYADHYRVVGHLQVTEGVHRLVAARQDAAAGPRFRSEEELDFVDRCPNLGGVDSIGEVLQEYGVDEVVVAPEYTANHDVGRAVAASLEGRCRVTDQATFAEKLIGEVPADAITAEWFLKADVQNHGGYETVKRAMDAVVAGLGLFFLAPLWPIIYLAIRLDSPGPVLYRQIRVGRYGRCFTMYKLRTMRTDAEKDGVRWAQQNDSRVTRLGGFLRRTRIDELPQLLNILRGDMSLVGPRPERPEFVNNLEQVLPHYRLRHLVKPGLSGWAQINYRYGASIADAHRKLCFDLYYLKNRSLDMDLGIIIRTAGTFLLGSR